MKRRPWDWISASMEKALICEVMRMKKIEAIIRPEKLHLLREKLDQKGFSGMTVTEVKGRGRQKGITLQWRAGDYKVEFLPKMKLEVVVEDADTEMVIDLICDVAQTGEAGDGKIFVYPVEDVVRVRTKERGCSAV
jgi:nitrogen regulatory protein P-II 1